MTFAPRIQTSSFRHLLLCWLVWRRVSKTLWLSRKVRSAALFLPFLIFPTSLVPTSAASLRPEKIKKTKGSVNILLLPSLLVLLISPSFTSRRANVLVSPKKLSTTPTKRTVLLRLKYRLLKTFHRFLPNPWIPALLLATPYVIHIIFAFF